MRERGAGSSLLVLSIGHSTRALEAFIRVLEAHGVRRVVDVRSLPRSRHTPQFNQETLPRALTAAGMEYTHEAELGGFRRPRPDSPNTGWRNPGFRGFADYMQSPEFGRGLRRLMALARRERVALMCAEGAPFRCHRSLIADALVIRGVRVEHIGSATGRRPHTLTPWARVDGTRLTYPTENVRSAAGP